MIRSTSKKLVLSMIATLAISTTSLSAADYGSVNGEKITKQDVATFLRNPNIDFDSLPKKSKDKVLEQIIEKKLLTDNAVNSGVSKEKAYKEALADLERDLALEVWMQNEFKKIKISDKEKKDYYEKNKAQFKVPTTLEARHILTKTEADAKSIIKDLDNAKDKKAKFVELAKNKSVGPSGPKGGYLGKFPETQMVPEFSKAAKELNKGAYSKTPVKTQYGFHVIYLEDKIAAKTLSYDEVQKRINQVLVQEKFRGIIKSTTDNLRKKAKIVIN